MTNYLRGGLSKKNAIKKFINIANNFYPISHVSNLESISDKFNFFQNKKPSALLNNTVAFYFNDKNECLHGARFIKNFHGNYLNKWTSKLGGEILVSHALIDKNRRVGWVKKWGGIRKEIMNSLF